MKTQNWIRALCVLFAFTGSLTFTAKGVADEMEAIKIELPDADFSGTPISYWNPNLEQESYKARAPFLAPKGTIIISKGKPVTASAKPEIGDLKLLTDGDKDYHSKSRFELPAGTQWVQVDLGEEKALFAILLWHCHEGKRVYFNVVVQASNDPEFKKDVTTLYNNDSDNSSGLGAGKDKEYFESNQGRLIDAKGVKTRYVRCYSRGNTTNDNNNYVEAEIWGK